MAVLHVTDSSYSFQSTKTELEVSEKSGVFFSRPQLLKKVPWKKIDQIFCFSSSYRDFSRLSEACPEKIPVFHINKENADLVLMNPVKKQNRKKDSCVSREKITMDLLILKTVKHTATAEAFINKIRGNPKTSARNSFRFYWENILEKMLDHPQNLINYQDIRKLETENMLRLYDRMLPGERIYDRMRYGIGAGAQAQYLLKLAVSISRAHILKKLSEISLDEEAGIIPGSRFLRNDFLFSFTPELILFLLRIIDEGYFEYNDFHKEKAVLTDGALKAFLRLYGEHILHNSKWGFTYHFNFFMEAIKKGGNQHEIYSSLRYF